MGVGLAFISALAFSSNYIFIQNGMKRSKKDNGEFLSLFTMVILIAVLELLRIAIYGGPRMPLALENFVYFALAGIFTAFVGRILLFAGIRRIGSSRVAALKNTAPVFTVIIAVLLLGERISFWGGVGMAVIFAALFLQALHDFHQSKLPRADETKPTSPQDSGQKAPQSKLRSGLLLSFSAALFIGLGQISRKQGMVDFDDPILGSLIGSSVALLLFLLMKSVNGSLKETILSNLRHFNTHFVVAGMLTGIAQISFFAALLYTNVSYASVVAAMEPIITVFLVKLFLRREEKVTLRMGATAVTIFLGTFIIIFGK
ncbi:DMT family transporter [Ferviditalea candida]|uniref:DMT family transporter n=1 Tax=Ferviditalea candida TaxID=3108399 RepID=A0ABU5ZHE1_9BACL|nr:DMT family transporter [Paenibacillaceae bacterium T2]